MRCLGPGPIVAGVEGCGRSTIGRARGVRELNAAVGGARLFANTLNLLAHPDYGVDAALQIVQTNRCFELSTADLGATCELVQSTLST